MAQREHPVVQPPPFGSLSRVKYAFRFIRGQARQGPDALERTKAKHVAATYGVSTEIVKRIKARFRNELSFGEGK